MPSAWPFKREPEPSDAPMLAYAFFFFVAFGAKVVLAFATIYFLLTGERSCNQCNGDTLPIRMRRPGRFLAKLMLGRIERRWCPRCGWEGMTRRDPKYDGGIEAAAREHGAPR